MKTLLAIWAIVAITGTGTVVYIDKGINDHIAQQVNPQQTINAEELQGSSPKLQVTYNPQETINGKALQGN